MTGASKGGSGKGMGTLIWGVLAVAALYFGYKYIQKRNTIVVEED